MSFVSIILYALLISTAKSLRNCEDCMTLRECPQAHQQALSSYTDEFRIKYNNAICQKFADMKVRICCSDFNEDRHGLNSRSDSYEGSDSNEAESTNNGDEIENHRNIHLLTKDCGQIDGLRIIGGTEAKLNEFPWLVLISRTVRGVSEFSCGGTLINSRYVLTAAHCLKDHNVISVRVGEHDISKDKACYGPKHIRQCEFEVQDILVSHKIIHPHYWKNSINIIHDIGLLRLRRPVNLTVPNAGPICLPLERRLRELDLIGSRGIVAGWGRTNEDNPHLSQVLQKVEVPINSPDTCKELYLRNRYSAEYNQQFQNILCADEEGKGSCKGDSGGPLIIRDDDDYKYVQHGIVSYGFRCGTDTPSVYTDVTKYMRWILDTIKP